MLSRGAGALAMGWVAWCLLAGGCARTDIFEAPGSGGSGGASGTGGTTSGGGAELDIADQLRGLPGVLAVSEGASEIPGRRYFLIDFDQPVDHTRPEGQHFTQRLVLHHRDTAAPLVLAATGYYLFLPEQRFTEPAALLDANQLFVEHRYFQPSRPDPADWALLDIAQAAADHHRIALALRPLYTGHWISTGTSKGGMTAVFHRRFYPADVEGTVAYVAPLSLGLEDSRYVDFVAGVGTAACRQRIEGFEREVLLRRDAMMARMSDQAAARGLGYDLIGVVPSFEGKVAGFAFAFWQYRDESACDSIPGAAASDDEVWRFFDEVARTLFATDSYVLGLEPYHWQAYTQLGTPGIDTTAIDDLLTVDLGAVDDLPSIELAPVFDPAPMEDVADWVADEGSHILFVYGENDPWTAAAFEVGGGEDAYCFVAPGGNHRANIAALAAPEREIALEALGAWAGVAPATPMKQVSPEPAEPSLFLGGRRGFP